MTHAHDHPDEPAYFDAAAATWDDPPKVERAAAVAAELHGLVPLTSATRLLEYGAGTGLVTQALAGAVGAVTLADPSSGMREVMAGKVDRGELPEDSRIWDLDLTRDPVPEDRFDLVVTVMTLHHIPDLVPVLRAFRLLLDEGGWVAIVDLEAEDGSFHGEGFTGHHGFVRADLHAQLEDAGFTEVGFRACHTVEREGGTYPLFLATARRP